MKVIGEGANGWVYSTAYKRAVLKCCGIDDTGYIMWLNFIAENQSNPWVPKLYSAPIVTKVDGDDFVFALIERLRPQKRWSESEMDRIPGYLDDIAKEDSNLKFVLDWLETVYELEYKYQKNGYRRSVVVEDIHDENIMIRGRGKYAQLVITDPLC